MSQTQSIEDGTQQVKEKVQDATTQARESAGQAMDQAKSTVRDQVDQKSTAIGEQLTSVADDVRKVGKELQNQDKATPARFADQGAERLEQLGGYLKESDGQRILGDIEDFARKQPWVVVVGGITLGFVASRFLKASSGRRYAGQYAPSGQSSPALPASGLSSTSSVSSTDPIAAGGSGTSRVPSDIDDAAPTYGGSPPVTEEIPRSSSSGPEIPPTSPTTGGQ